MITVTTEMEVPLADAEEAAELGFFFKTAGAARFADGSTDAPGHACTVAVAQRFGVVVFSDLRGLFDALMRKRRDLGMPNEPPPHSCCAGRSQLSVCPCPANAAISWVAIAVLCVMPYQQLCMPHQADSFWRPARDRMQRGVLLRGRLSGVCPMPQPICAANDAFRPSSAAAMMLLIRNRNSIAH